LLIIRIMTLESIESKNYPPIESHGIIGNMLTTALVSIQGEINFMCYPHFDSPAIFCKLLDANKGGFWNIKPICKEFKTKQSYWPDTNVLQTRFLMKSAVCTIVDYMPVIQGKGMRWLVRKVKVIRGDVDFEMKCWPTFDFGRKTHTVKKTTHGYLLASEGIELELLSYFPLFPKENGEIDCKFSLKENESATFVLKDPEQDVDLFMFKDHNGSCRREEYLFMSTIDYWQKWLERCTYKGRWREIVERSALVLKLLTFSPTGAIVAAPTCSLPEDLGGERNWDYRFTWIRDAAFTVYGLMRIGFTDEAKHFMDWIEARCSQIDYEKCAKEGTMPLKIMYSINGSEKIPEVSLPHLEGYRKSAPVRIGNDAVNQKQLDIFGEMMDSVYLSNKYGSLVSYDFWTHLHRIIEWVCDHWNETDEGIWEVRSGRQHFVYSKIMCWVAIDRGLRLADRRSFPAPRERIGAFTQSYGSESLDASTLIMSLVFFMAPNDPRHIQTLENILSST
ncbi:hypothetical protein SAMD00019534_006040, partial [Acytostelium subglobosum LB1]|uniref:hypothetical protein n=1 Tax=Acytostelium subglobosum LB1 TaxID=1410327 RepID=UPI000644F556